MADQEGDFWELLVEGEIFRVSRCLFTAYSPIFMQASLSGENPFDGKRAADVQELIEVMMAPDQKAIDDDNLSLMLEFAKEFAINSLSRRCKKYLMDKEIDYANFKSMIDLADQYQLQGLRDRSEAFLLERIIGAGKGDQSIFRLLHLAINCRSRVHIKMCMEKCASEFNFVQLETEFQGMPGDIIAGIMILKYVRDVNCQNAVEKLIERMG